MTKLVNKLNNKAFILAFFIGFIWTFFGTYIAYSLGLFYSGPHWLVILFLLPQYPFFIVDSIFFHIGEDSWIHPTVSIIFSTLVLYLIFSKFLGKKSK